MHLIIESVAIPHFPFAKAAVPSGAPDSLSTIAGFAPTCPA
jgi:hypothetical protein